MQSKKGTRKLRHIYKKPLLINNLFLSYLVLILYFKLKHRKIIE